VLSRSTAPDIRASAVDRLPQETANDLVAKAKKVRAAPSPTSYQWTVPFRDLAGFDAEMARAARATFQEALGSSQATSIYVMTLSADTDIGRLRQAAKDFRAAQDGSRALARINPASKNSSCLYVGSSEDTVLRLIQHLGGGNGRTYALHLAAWAGELSGCVEINVYHYGALDRGMRLLMEDKLSEDSKPLMGRRGNR
jgi:hypothetical protein